MIAIIKRPVHRFISSLVACCFFFRSCPLIFQLIYFYAKYAALDRSDFLTFSDIHLLFVSCRLSVCMYVYFLLSLLHHQNRTRNRQKGKTSRYQKETAAATFVSSNSSLFIRLCVDECFFFLSFSHHFSFKSIDAIYRRSRVPHT